MDYAESVFALQLNHNMISDLTNIMVVKKHSVATGPLFLFCLCVLLVCSCCVVGWFCSVLVLFSYLHIFL